MKCLDLPVRSCSKVLLLVAWVWLVLPYTASSGGMLPQELWYQASPRGLLWRPHLVKTLFRMVRRDRFISARALKARMRNLYRMRAGQKTINNRLSSRGYHAFRTARKPLLTANHCRLRLEWAPRWQNLTLVHWQHVIFGDESRFQIYPVDGRLKARRLLGGHIQQRCKAYKV